MRDYYETLGIPGTASADEIRQRYRFLAQAYHPDKFPDPRHKEQAEKTFKEVQEAYRTLCDPRRRAVYDLGRPPGEGPRPVAAEEPRRERREPAPRYAYLRERYLGLSGAQWVIAILFALDLLTPDPFRLFDEMTLFFLFFWIDRILAFFARFAGQ
jgi:curved DNA-binding protein CbpA